MISLQGKLTASPAAFCLKSSGAESSARRRRHLRRRLRPDERSISPESRQSALRSLISIEIPHTLTGRRIKQRNRAVSTDTRRSRKFYFLALKKLDQIQSNSYNDLS